MKRYLYTLGLAALILAPLSGISQGSQELVIRSIDYDDVQTPNYQVRVKGSTKTDGRMKWLELKTDYQTAPAWLDEVTFNYSVMLEADLKNLPEGAESPYTMFQGSVTYVNVPAGRYESSMFLDPYTFARHGEVKALHVSVSVNGTDVAQDADPKNLAKSEWWKKRTPSTTPLLSRDQSPWRFIEIEARPPIKP